LTTRRRRGEVRERFGGVIETNRMSTRPGRPAFRLASAEMERLDLGPARRSATTETPAPWRSQGDPVVSLAGLAQMTEAIMAFADRA
jgi:hypothetical protein